MAVIKIFWEKWKTFGHKVGNFQARLILSLFYFIVIFPFGMVVKYVSKPLRLEPSNTSNWLVQSGEAEDVLARARRQF